MAKKINVSASAKAAPEKPCFKKIPDEQIIEALNFKQVKKDGEWVKVRHTDEEGRELPLVTAENLWEQCRAKEVGHRSCRCGNAGCGNRS